MRCVGVDSRVGIIGKCVVRQACNFTTFIGFSNSMAKFGAFFLNRIMHITRKHVLPEGLNRLNPYYNDYRRRFDFGDSTLGKGLNPQAATIHFRLAATTVLSRLHCICASCPHGR